MVELLMQHLTSYFQTTFFQERKMSSGVPLQYTRQIPDKDGQSPGNTASVKHPDTKPGLPVDPETPDPRLTEKKSGLTDEGVKEQNDFVYLRDYAPSIRQEMRYAGEHNFIGRPVKGYLAGECILTRKAATQLTKVQAELESSGYSLKVYDCYRPQMAVDDFVAWSQDLQDQKMKLEFYPKVDKRDIFKLGYVAAHSGHTRGSTVDLTIVQLPVLPQQHYDPLQPLLPCDSPYGKRFRDNSIDMGTGFDCFDRQSHPANPNVPLVVWYHRQLLWAVMRAHGFIINPGEWWHFTLKDEPYKDTYFNFPVSAKEKKAHFRP